MTKLSFEVPLRHLDDFDEDQDFLFCLSFLFEHSSYVEYYQKFRAKRPKAITIIDNSYNELKKATGASTMCDLFHQYKPTMVVSPDSDKWDSRGLYSICEIMVNNLGKTFVLPVARSTEEIKWFNQKGLIYVAVPYEYRTAMGPRMNICPLHFLGLNSVQELLTFQPLSCDTGMPIKLAIQYKSLMDWIRKGSHHIDTVPAYFDLRLTKEQFRLAKENIKALKNLLTLGGL